MVLFSTLLFSNESDCSLKEFSFCESESIEENVKREEANNDNTKEIVYRNKKYRTLSNYKEFKKLSELVALSYGNGNKDIFVFIDPECKFCRAFTKDSMEHLSDAKYHIILYPLRKHKDAKKMISFILDGPTKKNKFKRFKSVLVDENFNPKYYLKSSKKSLEYVEKSLALGVEKKVKSTPSFFKPKVNNLSKIPWAEVNDLIN